MGFRTIIIDTHCKLDYELGYLIYRTTEKIKRISISEIQMLVVQTTNVAITSYLICELVKNNVSIIFCDERRNPHSQLLPFYGSYNTYKKYMSQIKWKQKIKDVIWKNIVKEKIKSEISFLKLSLKDETATLLERYYNEVSEGDTTNCEGHAARLYFSNIFYDGFIRNDDSKMNVYLNYGYSIIVSYINRTIASLGYLTQLGIHHIGQDNEFNFTYDLVEPFRVFVDIYATRIKDEDNFKDVMVNILNEKVSIMNKSQMMTYALNIYIQSVITALNEEDETKLIFPDSYAL